MAVTITWKISKEFHNNETEKYIYGVEVETKGTETVDSKDYESISRRRVDLDRPDTLVAYATFNKQSTLVTAVKTKLGAETVTDIENKIKSEISEQQNPLFSIPPD